MTKGFFSLCFILLVSPLFAQFGTQPPFTVSIEAVPQKVPGIHSFAFARSGSKWLVIGGRIKGLHGFSSNDGFPTVEANNDVVVIDTLSWQYWTSSLSLLPYNIADPLRSTNMQSIQEGDYLYIIGGYGYDSIQFNYVTFPTITAVHVDNMINAVVTAGTIAPHIRQVVNTNLRVCGAELMKLGSEYYLLFGHDFEGRYSDPPTPLFTQQYTNQVRKFTVADNGTTLSVSNFSFYTDTINFHRRDLNVFPVVKPGGNFGIGAYGGVFKYNTRLPYRDQIYLDGSSILVDSIHQQIMSQYTCAGFPLFDSITNTLYTTLLGGISLYDYNPISQQAVLDTLVPFISDITTLTQYANGTTQEAVLPVQLPGLIGSNAEFVPAGNTPMYANGVIKFRKLPSTKTLIGYLYGGIRAKLPNTSTSTANDTVYRICITPDFTSSISGGKPEIEYFSSYPNPASSSMKIAFKLSVDKNIYLELYDICGKKTMISNEGHRQKGMHEKTMDISFLSPGIYFLKLQTEADYRLLNFSVIK